MGRYKLSQTDRRNQEYMATCESTPEYYRLISLVKIAADDGEMIMCDRYLEAAQQNLSMRSPEREEIMQLMIVLLICKKYFEWRIIYKSFTRNNAVLDFDFDACIPFQSQTTVEIEFIDPGRVRVKPSSLMLNAETDTELCLRYIIDTLPLFESFCNSEQFRVGRVYLDVSDFGNPECLSFSGENDRWLLPDPIFFASQAYAKQRKAFVDTNIDWERRLKTVFWRGATTGFFHSLDQLPRFKLCKWAQSSRWADSCDIGFSSIVQRGPEDAERINSEMLLKSFVEDVSFDRFRYHIDIDGNSNSWPGLFIKLLSGSAVLKIESESGFKQWFYHRLIPWHNYVPICKDLHDLDEAIRFCLSHDDQLREIARNGQLLAQTMTIENETKEANTTIFSYLNDTGN